MKDGFSEFAYIYIGCLFKKPRALVALEVYCIVKMCCILLDVVIE